MPSPKTTPVPSAVSLAGGEELLIVRRVNSQRMLDKHSPTIGLRPGREQRIAHVLSDYGRSWSDPFLVSISGVLCHGTLARTGDRLLFSIPNGLEPPDVERTHAAERRRGAVYHSADRGKTWIT